MGIVAGTCLVFEGLGGGSGSGAYVFKGSVDTDDDLEAISDAWTEEEKEKNAGWVYNVRDTGKNYAWDGTAWDDIGGEFAQGAGITITSASGTNTISVTGADSATSGQFAVSDGNDSITWRQPVAADLSDVTATATEINVLDGITATTQELNYVGGVTSSIQDQLDVLDQTTSDLADAVGGTVDAQTGAFTRESYKATPQTELKDIADTDTVCEAIGKLDQNKVPESELEELGEIAEVTGAASTVVEDNLTADRALVSNGSGKIAVSTVTSTELGYSSGVTSNIQTQFGDITGKIPEQATAQNQLADKEFVNSSIATNTAHFIGTFANVTARDAYQGDITNNDYCFVINQLVTDEGDDWATFNDLDAYNKSLLTNFDYAWVVNEDNFDLYRFDIVTQQWQLRAQNTPKEGISLNTAYNRYKATVTDDDPPVVTWEYEYTLNNSSFTASQWEAINSNATQTNIAQITTNQTNIGDLTSLTTTAKSNLVAAINELETNKADTTDIGNATITFKANGATISGQSFTTNAKTDVEIDLGNTGLVDDVQVNGTTVVTNKVANIPIGTSSVLGVYKVNPNQGVSAFSAGDLCVIPANENELIAKTQGYKPIVPNTLDKAIREGLGNNSLTWTDEYKTSARNTIGATQVVVRDWS